MGSQLLYSSTDRVCANLKSIDYNVAMTFILNNNNNNNNNAHITNIKDVKYSRIFTNIKTGYEYYNWLFFVLLFSGTKPK